MTTTTTGILLVDDHLMLRKGLRLLIEAEEGLIVVGEANDGREAIDQVRKLTPDIVVMDINMPNLNGIEATRQILAESPQARVLALSIHSGKQYVENMLEAGASGYLLKESAPEELIKAISVLREGKSYLSADITEIVLSRLRTARGAGQEAHLLASKLQRPELTSAVVSRSQLIERLETGREKKMTLVTAPAGYGKSTLVCDWLEHCSTPSVWLTIDQDDNDLDLFLEFLIGAIRSLFSDTCPQLKKLAEAATLPPVSILAAALSNDLERIPQPFILVLDDFDLITNKEVNDLVSQMLKRSLCSMHLVLISNRDPFLPFATLRADDDVTEIRLNDLQFSVQETTTFLENSTVQEIDPETASIWTERTEGWVAGLQLAIYSLTGSDKAEDSTSSEFATKSQSSEELLNWRQILTNREYEILLLLKERLRDKEIADQLCISTETVKSHLKNIYSKLYANNRRDAIVKAEEAKILKKT